MREMNESFALDVCYGGDLNGKCLLLALLF
jgi:hypothetical protein